MNRSDLQHLSKIRLIEAKSLLAIGLNDGAYYLAGYAVECALKACIAKRISRHDFPDREIVQGLYTHSLRELLVKSLLGAELQVHAAADPVFHANWNIVGRWSVESRYTVNCRQDAESLVAAVGHGRSNVMDQALLVNIDVPLGREVIDAVEAAGLPVNVALWAWLSEYEEWRLILASRKLDREGLRRQYELVNSAMDAGGIGIWRAPELLLLKTTDPFIRELRRLFAKTKSVEGMRLGGHSIGGRSVRDAWVYRIT